MNVTHEFLMFRSLNSPLGSRDRMPKILTNPNSLKVSLDFGLYLGTPLVRLSGITVLSNFVISTLARLGYPKLQTIPRPEPLYTLPELTSSA